MEELGDSPEAVASSHQATVATFLDTPGQEIFYRMRTNGARVADAVLLVVSGEEWVSGLDAWGMQLSVWLRVDKLGVKRWRWFLNRLCI